MGRQPMIMIATGAPGVGKTYQTTRELEMYIRTDPSVGRIGRKVIIFDTNDEYRRSPNGIEYKSVKYNVRDPNDNGKFIRMLKNIEIRRVLPFWAGPTGGKNLMTFEDKKKTLNDIITNYYDGLILLEDFNTYIISTQSEDTISMLCSARHKGTDIMIHLQSLAAVTPRMFQNCNYIRFHYQADDIARYKNKIDFEQLKIVQNIVNLEYFKGNIRYFVYYNQRTKKIKGCTPDQYLEGVEMFKKEYKASSMLQKYPYIYFER